MSKDVAIYDFFLDARRSLVTLWEDRLPLSELRQIAEEKVNERTSGKSQIQYLGDVLPRGEFANIGELVLDPDFLGPLGRRAPDFERVSADRVVAAFLPVQFGIMSFFLQEGMEEPGFSVEDFTRLQVSLQPGQMLLRTGFLSSEFDVLESAAFGFHGVCLHARHLDKFQIQYLTELCRDFRMSALVIADSLDTLTRVLSTDAPYVGIWGYSPRDFAADFSLFDALSRRIPAACLSLAFYPNIRESDVEILRSLGLRGAFS